jgi:hypothetical protein
MGDGEGESEHGEEGEDMDGEEGEWNGSGKAEGFDTDGDY